MASAGDAAPMQLISSAPMPMSAPAENPRASVVVGSCVAFFSAAAQTVLNTAGGGSASPAGGAAFATMRALRDGRAGRNAVEPLSATGARATLESAAARVEAPREGTAQRETRARAEMVTVAMELMVRSGRCGGSVRPERSRFHQSHRVVPKTRRTRKLESSSTFRAIGARTFLGFWQSHEFHTAGTRGDSWMSSDGICRRNGCAKRHLEFTTPRARVSDRRARGAPLAARFPSPRVSL